MVAVAVVVTVYTAGAAAGVMSVATGASTTMGAGMAVLSGGATFSTATLAAAAIGGAAGNIASQGVGLAMGAQHQFRWEAVGQAALTSAVSSGVGTGLNELGYPLTDAGGWEGSANAAGRAAAATSVDRLLQGGWTWRAVAASAVSAGLNRALTPDVPATATAGPTKQAWLAGFGSSMAADLAGQWLGRKDHHVDGGSAFASTLGLTMGDRIVEGWSKDPANLRTDAAATPQAPIDESPRAELAGFLAMDADEALQQDFERYVLQAQGLDPDAPSRIMSLAWGEPRLPWPGEPSPLRPAAPAPAPHRRRSRTPEGSTGDDDFVDMGSTWLLPILPDSGGEFALRDPLPHSLSAESVQDMPNGYLQGGSRITSTFDGMPSTPIDFQPAGGWSLGGTAGYSAVSTWDAYRRVQYKARSVANSAEFARQLSGLARTHTAEAEILARQAFEARQALRTATQNTLSPGGKLISMAIEKAYTFNGLYAERARRLGANGPYAPYDVYKEIIEASGRSNQLVSRINQFTKIAGPIGMGLGIYGSATAIANAPAGETGRVTAEEGGSFLGGMAGGMAATYAIGGLALGATAVGLTVAAPVVLVAGAGAGLTGAYFGSSYGREAGSFYYKLWWQQ